METMVICIGNRARGDDGAGRRVAELLDGTLPPQARLVSAPQLDVVLAEEVAAAALVVFVDAERRTEPLVDTRDVAAERTAPDTHGVTPGALIALAEALYGRVGRAVLVTLAGPEMGHGEGLSETAEAASIEAASVVRALLSEAPD